MNNTNYAEILKQGQIELNYDLGLQKGFKNKCVFAPIYPTFSDEFGFYFTAMTKNGQIINSFDDSIQQFQIKVHPYMVSFKGSFAALKTRNAREVVGLDGKTIAEFPQAVQPQILYTGDDTFVSLETDTLNKAGCTKIVSTDGKKYQPFCQDVSPILIPGKREGEFHAIMLRDFKTVLSNLFDRKTTMYHELPRFDIDSVSLGEDYTKIIRIDDVFITLTDDKIIGTDGIIYGRFDKEVKPESLAFIDNKFFALDREPSEVYFRIGPKVENVKEAIDNIKEAIGTPVNVISFTNKKSEEYKTLAEVPRTVTIDTRKLEKILTGTDVKK